MFEPKYPNLELLEFKARQILAKDEAFTEKMQAAQKQQKFISLYLDAQVFPQIWGSTCMGFDVMADGSPAIGGCAMTKAYTTVFHDASISDMYIVFFGDKPCYSVTNATQEFLEDLRNRNLAPFSRARLRY